MLKFGICQGPAGSGIHLGRSVLMSETLKLANTISTKSLPVLEMAKEAVNSSHELSLKEGIKNERTLFKSTFSLLDRKEGMKAFLEKRKAKFLNK